MHSGPSIHGSFFFVVFLSPRVRLLILGGSNMSVCIPAPACIASPPLGGRGRMHRTDKELPSRRSITGIGGGASRLPSRRGQRASGQGRRRAASPVGAFARLPSWSRPLQRRKATALRPRPFFPSKPIRTKRDSLGLVIHGTEYCVCRSGRQRFWRFSGGGRMKR